MSKFRKMDFRLVAVLALAALLAACGGQEPAPGESPTAAAPATSPSASGGSGLCANEYLPVVQGATWSYTGTGLEESYSYTTTVSEVRADGFEYTHNFDNLVVAQQWGCSTAGLAALEYGGGPEATLNTAGLTASYETIASSGVALPHNLAVGQSWSQTYDVEGTLDAEGLTMSTAGTVTHSFTAVREESVTVPAGTFTALRVEGTHIIDLQATMAGGLTIPFTFESVAVHWWVPGIGMVRSESIVSIEGGEAFTDTTELTAYSIP